VNTAVSALADDDDTVVAPPPQPPSKASSDPTDPHAASVATAEDKSGSAQPVSSDEDSFADVAAPSPSPELSRSPFEEVNASTITVPASTSTVAATEAKMEPASGAVENAVADPSSAGGWRGILDTLMEAASDVQQELGVDLQRWVCH